ncbi:MAG: HAD family hydrolase [Candidatus Aminicenantales bacterium]
MKAVIFDLDGTLVDVPYEWPKIRRKLGVGEKPILSHLASLSGPERGRKWKLLEKIEAQATRKAILKEGVARFLDFLDKNSIRKALVTNNSRKNVDYLLRKFKLKFECVISRESGLWKPSAEPLLAALKKLGVEKEEACVVGDSHFDAKAAAEAGVKRIFLLRRQGIDYSSLSSEVVDSFVELEEKIKALMAEE